MFGSASGRLGLNSAMRPGLGFGGRGFGSERFGRGFGFRGRGFGCWGCGFGWGWGLGFGWGGGWGLGWGWNPWWYSPLWYDPFWYGSWGWPGYYDAYPLYAPPSGPVTYPPPYGPGDDNSSGANSDQSQSYAAPQSDVAPQMYSNPGSGSDVTPDLGPDTGNVAESAPTVLLYTKDGTTFPASDYWVADGKLHYRITYGGENVLEINQLDLQRTVDENAKRGIRFTLKPQPVPSTPAPVQTGATTTSTTT